MTANSIRKKYLDQVKAALSCPRIVKRDLVKLIAVDVDAIFADNPDADEDALERALGTPDAFAEEYISLLGAQKLQSLIHRATIRKRIITVACTALILILLALVIGSIINLYGLNNSKGSVKVTVTEIIEDEPACSNDCESIEDTNE